MGSFRQLISFFIDSHVKVNSDIWLKEKTIKTRGEWKFLSHVTYLKKEQMEMRWEM